MRVPGAGFCAITVPRLGIFPRIFFVARFFVILPTPHFALASAFLALLSVSPTSYGTTHLVAAGVDAGGVVVGV